MISFSKTSLFSFAFLSLSAVAFLTMQADETELVPLLIFIVVAACALVLSALGYGRKKQIDLTLDWILAFAAAALIFSVYPNEFFDDAGFVMRYLDNFSAGHFYAYNPTDGPVLGISSPFQGIISGALSFLSPLTPEQILRYTAFGGLVALAFFVIQILRTTSGENTSFVLLSIVVLLGSKMFLNVMKCGLESSMHIAIVLSVFWSYYTKRTRLMFFLFALAIFSKLDSLPSVAVVALFWLSANLKTLLPFRFNNTVVKQIVLFTVVPLAVWIVVAWSFFGSPLPQSAYAKIHFHAHPNDSWFPFFTRYVTDGGFSILAFFTAICFCLTAGFILFRRQHQELKLLAPGTAFIATMVLYYFYNPGEKMMWYYALPDILLLIQLVISLAFLSKLVDQYWLRTSVVLLSCISVYSLCYPAVASGKVWLEEYLGIVEYERDQLGIYLGRQISADDTLMTWHGLTGRYTKGYVLDMSGLNSKLVTNYQRNSDTIARRFKPNWVVNTAAYDYIEMFNKPPFTFDTAFYDITAYNYPNWIVYKRVSDSELHEYPVVLRKPNVWGGDFSEQDGVIRISGLTKLFAFNAEASQLTGVLFGVAKSDQPFECIAELRIKDTIVETKTIHVFPQGREVPGAPSKVQNVTWRFATPIPPKTEVVVKVTRLGEPVPFTLVQPYCLQRY